MRTYKIPDVLALVAWRQQRHHSAYLSHRKRRETESSIKCRCRVTCAILYHFGTGPVRGFALTLALGVVCSMFTAITCSRTFLLLLARAHFGRNDVLYRLVSGWHPRLAITKRMGLWFGLSGLIIVPGLVVWLGLSGIKYGIDFTGGTEISAQFTAAPSAPQIEAVLKRLGH